MNERTAITVRSAGDRGDCCYTLPVVKWLCAQQGTKAVYYIEAATYTREMLTPDRWCGLDRIIREQPYILDVRELKHGNLVQINLNDFRSYMQKAFRMPGGRARERHLMDWMLDAHRVPASAANEPWLTIPPNKVAEIVINRAGPGRDGVHVYHNPLFPWRRVIDKYGSKAVFIGTPLEHEVFCAVYGPVDYYPTPDLYEAARVISGCTLFIGNQSCPHAIAAGLFKRIILEVWPSGANCIVSRPGVLNAWHDAHKIELPEL